MSGSKPGESGPIAVAPAPRAPAHAATVELRLALVCYGGVSLAIYMHGVTLEIQKLVAASRAYEENPDENPFEESDTEHAYWQALARREQDDRHPHPRGGRRDLGHVGRRDQRDRPRQGARAQSPAGRAA